MITLSYLFELTRWKQEAVKGNVSNKGLATLTKAGVRKPVLTHLAGINTGTENIRKKAGAVHLHHGSKIPSNDTLEGYTGKTLPNGRIITLEPRAFKNRDNVGIVNRHETNEARGIRKLINTGVNPSDAVKPAAYTGGHVSPNVIKTEKKDIGSLTGIYPHLKNEKVTKELLDYRHGSEEYKDENMKHIKHLHPSRVISNIKQRIGNFRSVLEKHGPNSFVKKHDKDENINQEKLDQYWDKRWNKEQDYYNREAKRKMKELNKQ